MECNKDEAVRAKQVAESKMQRGEFVEALRFAMKAKKLYADVENIAQILAVCEIHNSAQNKLSGCDMNWYGILQTERLAEEATIKKQYRKLALLLHPDKNKFPGAEAAFKLIGEANRILGDPAKRSLYDMKFKASVITVAPKTSSHHSNGKVGNATNHQKKSSSNTPFWNAHQQAEQQTFWTSCKHCNSKYQFLTNIVNVTVLCQNCLKPFAAHAVRHPVVTPVVFNIPKGAPMHVPPKPAQESKGGKPLDGGCADAFVRSYPSCATGVGEKYKGKKSKDGYVPASKTMGSQTSANVGSKRVRQSAPDSRKSFNTGNRDEIKNVNVRENDVDPSRSNVRRSSRNKQQVSYAENPEDDIVEIPSKKPREIGSFDTNEVEEKNVPASGGLSNDNNPASSVAGVVDQNKEVRNKISSPPEETVLRNANSHVQGEKVFESDVDLRKSKEENCSPLNSNVPSDPEIIHCPDADFNDFEKDKADGCFAVNQFWAIYDSNDSMPRFYALVNKVASPFKLQITWLEPDPDDHGGIDLYDADLPIACGKFKLGDSQKTTDRGMFSHQIQCRKGKGKGSYLVYPKTGETWAIFRDWDIKWSSNPDNYLECEFEYVEILSDFAENVGIQVAYLGKVRGFVSLFQKVDKKEVNISCVLPNELYRFSHRIPSYRMTGNEREGVPIGCSELDPAALPNNFFEVGDNGDANDVRG